MIKRKALFLDRDGVVCQATPRGTYLVSLEQFKILDGIIELLQKAKDKGYVIVVVTNQPQVAKGLISLQGVEIIHKKMQEELSGFLEAVFYCPHIDEDCCECRKPKPGMILEAVKQLNLDISQSFILGDSWRDINVGKAAGCKTIFFKNEYNSEELPRCSPDFTISSLNEAENII